MRSMWSLMLAVACAALLATSPGCEKSPSNPVSETPAHDPVPEVYKVRFETTKGNFVVEVTRAWAPLAAERFYYLVQNRFFPGQRFYRVLSGHMAQFGLNTLPPEKQWLAELLVDEPVRQSNRKGTIAFASSGPHTRSTQFFINLRDNTDYDVQRFAPFGKIVFGMDVVESLYSGYGELAPTGNGPNMNRVTSEGLQYLTKEFPLLDYVRDAVFVD